MHGCHRAGAVLHSCPSIPSITAMLQGLCICICRCQLLPLHSAVLASCSAACLKAVMLKTLTCCN